MSDAFSEKKRKDKEERLARMAAKNALKIGGSASEIVTSVGTKLIEKVEEKQALIMSKAASTPAAKVMEQPKAVAPPAKDTTVAAPVPPAPVAPK